MDKHAFFKALESGELPLGAYATYLRAWTAALAAVEECLNDCTHPAVIELAGLRSEVLPALHGDLWDLADACPADPPLAVERAGEWAAGIRLCAGKIPAGLIGILYVTEGSGLGASILAPQARACFGFGDGPGADALSASARSAEQNWSAFAACLDRIDLSSVEDEAATAAAVDYFNGLRRFLDALIPYNKVSLRPLAFTLNPHAGNLPVTKDPREIAAARVAARRCWQSFPYLEARYGLKGRLFADSDGAWLATLANLDEKSAERQIVWLGNVLAVRGMPTIILEEKLRCMAEAFDETFPDLPHKAALFTKLADDLSATRAATLAAKNVEALVRDFVEEVATDEPIEIPALLVGAVVDEANGAKDALSAIHNWMLKANYLPPRWAEPADRLISQTGRQLEKSRP